MIATARILLVVLLLPAMGCASTPSGRPAQNRSLLSSEELLASGHSDAFSTVQSLRPHWLQLRGGTSSRAETVKVYLDGSLLGGPDQLRQITTRSISTMRYYDALEATQRWGLEHGQGAIVVSTRKS